MTKTILITGGSTGIGAETARQLAPGNIILVHYNASKIAAETVAGEVNRQGGQAHLFQADLTTEAACVALVNQVAQNVDHLDVLINNAGGLIQRQPITELQWELMERIFALNVFSVMKLSSLCLPLLRQGTKPCIVNLTSIAMRHGAPSATIYGAAKSAIDAFTRGLAKEVAPDIRVNAVAPGVIETPFHEKVTTPEQMQAFKNNTPLQRNGQAGHIALAIKMLIENDFMTGETIDVNGGLLMR
ncbi:MAG: SDR family oxidoreductase [Anaerolineae bacterium]|nr:SDR family oxidoreductase [Anaerolineae bacterium]